MIIICLLVHWFLLTVQIEAVGVDWSGFGGVDYSERIPMFCSFPDALRTILLIVIRSLLHLKCFTDLLFYLFKYRTETREKPYCMHSVYCKVEKIIRNNLKWSTNLHRETNTPMWIFPCLCWIVYYHYGWDRYRGHERPIGSPIRGRVKQVKFAGWIELVV